MALTFSLAGTASATISNSCTVGEFGNIGGGTSQLKVACTLTTAVGGTSTFYKTEDFPEAMWHTGAARQITTTAVVSGGKTITASAGHFSTADINHSISGPGVPGGAWMVAATSTTATLSIPLCTACPGVTTPTKPKPLLDNSARRPRGAAR